jgi:hypothetical protein
MKLTDARPYADVGAARSKSKPGVSTISCVQENGVVAGDPSERAFGPALSTAFFLMLHVHLFDPGKVSNIAAGQMKLHRSPLGMV